MLNLGGEEKKMDVCHMTSSWLGSFLQPSSSALLYSHDDKVASGSPRITLSLICNSSQKVPSSISISMCPLQIKFWLALFRSCAPTLIDQSESYGFYLVERAGIPGIWIWHQLKGGKTFLKNQKEDDGESDWTNESVPWIPVVETHSPRH